MKLRYSYLSILLLSLGCSSYKQLQPKPALSPAENGYIEIKNEQKNFVLKKEKKYFLSFPPAQESNFYLVLDIPQKKQFNSFLSAQLLKKKTYGEKIADESTLDTQSVYPIQKNGTGYFLLIDGVKTEAILNLKYRFSPQWRFKFENKHQVFNSILQSNKTDRSAYKSIGGGAHLEGLDFSKEINTLNGHTAELNKVYKELLAIESIFPASIVNSTDEAYKNYKTLKADIEEELDFQSKYLAVLNFFNKEFLCRGKTEEMLKSVDDFTAFFNKKDKFPSTIISEAQTIMGSRLNEVAPFYDTKFSGKDNSKPFDPQKDMTDHLFRTGILYQSAGIPTPADYTMLVNFVKDFDAKSTTTSALKDTMTAIKATIQNQTQMPADDFFGGIVKRATINQSRIPQPIDQSSGKFQNYKCSAELNKEITALSTDLNTSLEKYKEAEVLVFQLNSFKAQKDYSTMLGMLKQKLHLDFLIDKYRSLDKLSIEEQSQKIEAALSNRRWATGEQLLSKLHEDINFLNPAEVYPIKAKIVDELEESIYAQVDKFSRERINKFLEDNISVLENVDSLYSDSVFLPAYKMTFSSGSKKDLLQKQNDLIAHLAKTKENEFPAKAVKLLYDQFNANPNDMGVQKARAIVAHGKYYKGDDKKIQQRISECDPWTSKWITKPADYRRVFALPVTDKVRGKNKYVIRMNVSIETDAAFPVYDVNIKLPKDVAENAGTEQWYNAISLNKILLKNEGRFSISAPSATNNYECQITPVQMNKGKGNILEITFEHNSFKVHQVSVMVQKPLIKKN